MVGQSEVSSHVGAHASDIALRCKWVGELRSMQTHTHMKLVLQHPNYFGNLCVWAGIAMLNAPTLCADTGAPLVTQWLILLSEVVPALVCNWWLIAMIFGCM